MVQLYEFNESKSKCKTTFEAHWGRLGVEPQLNARRSQRTRFLCGTTIKQQQQKQTSYHCGQKGRWDVETKWGFVVIKQRQVHSKSARQKRRRKKKLKRGKEKRKNNNKLPFFSLSVGTDKMSRWIQKNKNKLVKCLDSCCSAYFANALVLSTLWGNIE